MYDYGVTRSFLCKSYMYVFKYLPVKSESQILEPLYITQCQGHTLCISVKLFIKQSSISRALFEQGKPQDVIL